MLRVVEKVDETKISAEEISKLPSWKRYVVFKERKGSYHTFLLSAVWNDKGKIIYGFKNLENPETITLEYQSNSFEETLEKALANKEEILYFESYNGFLAYEETN